MIVVLLLLALAVVPSLADCADPTVTVTYPSANNITVTDGELKTITWTRSSEWSSIITQKVWLTRVSEQDVQLWAGGSAGELECAWLVDGFYADDQCKIRVDVTGNNQGGGYREASDASNSYFTILDPCDISLTLNAPNDGATIFTNTTVPINWTIEHDDGTCPTNLRFQIWLDRTGVNPVALGSADLTEGTYSWNWVVSEAHAGESCRIRLSYDDVSPPVEAISAPFRVYDVNVYAGQSIQTKVDDAPAGATIRVHDGTYATPTTKDDIQSCLFMQPGIGVASVNGPDAVTIAAPAGATPVVFLGGTAYMETKLDGFTLVATPTRDAILARDTPDGSAFVSNCRVQGWRNGALVEDGYARFAQCSFEHRLNASIDVDNGNIRVEGCTFDGRFLDYQLRGVLADNSYVSIFESQFDGFFRAIDATGTTMSIDASRFEWLPNETGAGIVLNAQDAEPSLIDDCEFIRGCNAIWIAGSSAPGGHDIRNSTMYGQTCAAIKLQTLSGVAADPDLGKNIISQCDIGVESIGTNFPSFRCNNVWDCGLGNYVGVADPTGTEGNLSTDPLFCAPEALEFSLAANSPCAAANVVCPFWPGAMGASDETCAAIPVTVLHANGFETGDFYQSALTAGMVNVITSVKRTGRYCLRVVTTGPSPIAYYRMEVPKTNDAGWNPIELDRAYLTFYFNNAGYTPNVSDEIVAFCGASGKKLSLRLKGNGQLEAVSGIGGNIVPLGSAPGGYARIDVMCGRETSAGASDGTAIVRINGAPYFLSALSNRAEPTDSVTFGKSVVGATDLINYYYDDVVLSSRGWLENDPGVVMLNPNAAGTFPQGDDLVTDWLPAIGFGSRHQAVDDWISVPTDNDQTYLLNSTSDGEAKVTLNLEPASAPKVPVGATIEAVTPIAVLRDLFETTRVKLLMQLDGVPYTSGSTADASGMYQPMLRVWNLNPKGAAPDEEWEVGDLANLEVGLIDYTLSAHTLRGTAVGAMVLYTVDSGFSKVEPDVAEEQTPVMGEDGALRAWPNPTTSGSRFAFALSRPDAVSLIVYDVSGRAVRSVVRGRLTAGAHEMTWDGRDDSGNPLPTGVYFMKLSTSEKQETQKLVLVR